LISQDRRTRPAFGGCFVEAAQYKTSGKDRKGDYMFCQKCGTALPEDAKFCAGCGTSAMSTGVEINQEKAVNIIHAQPAALPAGVSDSQNTAAADEKFCFSCGSVIKKAAEICPKCGVNQSGRGSTAAIDVYCASCGKKIKKEAAICPFCGVKQEQVQNTDYPPGYVPKNYSSALLFCIFLGGFGGHRFYVGKAGTAVLMIAVTVLTFGIGGSIWYIIDLVKICTGKFTDKQGYPLKKN
jgi:TM2 domain-containing membrane protein YozV